MVFYTSKLLFLMSLMLLLLTESTLFFLQLAFSLRSPPDDNAHFNHLISNVSDFTWPHSINSASSPGLTLQSSSYLMMHSGPPLTRVTSLLSKVTPHSLADPEHGDIFADTISESKEMAVIISQSKNIVAVNHSPNIFKPLAMLITW